ncbi:MAG: amylo-alpha-1,6-glucosidase [Salinibacterium sp.]|nr:amylo-alpha-1,6-glucosidase [Salinibacterium sp.]
MSIPTAVSHGLTARIESTQSREGHMDKPLQPLLNDELVVLRAPTQVWSAPDGTIGSRPIHGVYFSDLRVVSKLEVRIAGAAPEVIAVAPDGADTCTFTSIVRSIGNDSADPGIIATQRRAASTDGVTESIELRSRLGHPFEVEIVVNVAPDCAPLDRIKLGAAGVNRAPAAQVSGTTVRWADNGVHASIEAPGAKIIEVGESIELRWMLSVPARGGASVGWVVTASDDHAVVSGDRSPAPWAAPFVTGDERLARWVGAALSDLDALRMTTTSDPPLGFVAAGAPWFFTLFGRDSLWTARFMLPLGTELAWDTLRVLAGLQGSAIVPDRAEEPGKIMHELRRGVVHLDDDSAYLPPLYYGTVDATALWVILLHDAWKWGLDDANVESLMSHLEAALNWLRDHADADGDGLLEYIDLSGHGLANQGWKDSGDSVQWRDGRLAEGPIALCEVQAYAYEAAIGGAAILEHFGRDGSSWRDWAAALKQNFHDTFWVDDADGPYPAIALDAKKRRVDTLTSNIGHLLGTGLIDAEQSALIARRLVSPELNSGFGLRTMSTASDGYWPLSYHGGSVWTHDTAIAIMGLSKAGFRDEAGELIDGLLAAASGFEYRMPELHSGESAAVTTRPIPYPAACRPQAWSAAAAVAVVASVLGLSADAQNGTLTANAAGPDSRLGPGGFQDGGFHDGGIQVDGIQFAGDAYRIDSRGVTKRQ